jgi:hypothetical protein
MYLDPSKMIKQTIQEKYDTLYSLLFSYYF